MLSMLMRRFIQSECSGDPCKLDPIKVCTWRYGYPGIRYSVHRLLHVGAVRLTPVKIVFLIYRPFSRLKRCVAEFIRLREALVFVCAEPKMLARPTRAEACCRTGPLCVLKTEISRLL